MSAAWIAVACADHVRRGREGGFMQVCHGKGAPLRRLAYVAVLAVGILALIHPRPRLLWNATASVPMGLYAVHPARDLAVGDLAIVAPPGPVARYLAAGGLTTRAISLPWARIKAVRDGPVSASSKSAFFRGRLLRRGRTQAETI